MGCGVDFGRILYLLSSLTRWSRSRGQPRPETGPTPAEIKIKGYSFDRLPRRAPAASGWPRRGRARREPSSQPLGRYKGLGRMGCSGRGSQLRRRRQHSIGGRHFRRAVLGMRMPGRSARPPQHCTGQMTAAESILHLQRKWVPDLLRELGLERLRYVI